jgi:UDP-N-acetylmuramate--alanine ligase
VLYGEHSHASVDRRSGCVIYSEAVPADNVERRAAARLGLAEQSYSQAVGALMNERRGLAVAGTHGKSTVTAMVAKIFERAGLDPTVICGAAPRGAHSGGRGGHGEWLIAEACEYRENFRHLRPELAVVLGIEPDHFDYYNTPVELLAAFRRFVERVPAAGIVIANADCEATRQSVTACRAQVVTFGLTAKDAAWQARNIRHIHGRYGFELWHQGQLVASVLLQVPGRHQVANALAAAAAAHTAGAPMPEIVAGLEDFRGLQRRLEFVARASGVELWDDYAHHPTEVQATLMALRAMYPGRRLWCVFQPHQVSRTRALVDEFAASLHNADRVAVTEVFVARETPDECPRKLAEELAGRARGGTEVLPCNDPRAILDDICDAVRPGDVVVTMGAGDIRKRFDELADRLRANCTSG